jgi:folate-binding protein YgfZ
MDFVQGGVQVVRWFGAAPAPPAGAAELDAGAHACLRIASGEPLVGTDSEPSTLALELPIVDHISLTKGCYTGQEIVARIHTYGHTNRSLCRLAITGTGAIAAGTALSEPDDDDPVGRVMSAADIPGAPGRIAFGFVPAPLAVAGTRLRLVAEPPAEVTVL